MMSLTALGASLVAQIVKNLLAVQWTWVQSLSREGSMEKEMATHSSILAWRIPWTKEPVWLYSPRGCKESDMAEAANTTLYTGCYTQGVRGSAFNLEIAPEVQSPVCSSWPTEPQPSLLCSDCF